MTMKLKVTVVLFVFLGLLSGCAGAQKKAAAVPGDIVAKVGDQVITASELEAKAKPQLMKMKQQEFQLRKSLLDNMINDKLYEMEAKSKGISKDELIKAEVDGKLSAVPQEKVDELYDRYKGRMQGTKEENEPKIRNYLRQQMFVDELRAKYKTESLLEQPRVSVSAADGAVKGPKTAPVMVVEFSDFQCPYSKRVQETVAEVQKKYGDKIQYVYRDFPLEFHKNAQKAAEASSCAGEQGKFWQFHDKLFEDQSKLEVQNLKDLAKTLGLDSAAFDTCLDSGKYAKKVQKSIAEAQEAGVNGTPAFFINGIFLSGAVPLENFTEIIDQELAKKK
jgi:protein-disulfide isomerase